uniref:Ribosomal protein L14 n=1 Tax=Cafeteria roenbergensis TaxID=33653 RepID=Q9TAK1_CAFRO|nr:ribosomal protein L14 [Cafeteria roenbergensis]AAF05785.1 ribosomal protein L14 [Cafeteria roenbergensis]
MLQRGSVVEIVDNSGARVGRCICVLEGFFNKTAVVGSLIVLSIRGIRSGSRRVKAGQVSLAVIVRTKAWTKFKDGSQSRFQRNCAVLLTRKKQILGTKVFGPVSRQLRKKKYLRILLASGSNFF